MNVAEIKGRVWMVVRHPDGKNVVYSSDNIREMHNIRQKRKDIEILGSFPSHFHWKEFIEAGLK